jgi:acyl-CoA thioester hydrolase
VRSTTHLRVRFADTDAAGIVHYAHYLAFLEASRAEALRQLDLPQAYIAACALQAPILEAVLRYRAPARFDDVLMIQTWVAELDGARFRFRYEIRHAENQALVAASETLHARSGDVLLDGPRRHGRPRGSAELGEDAPQVPVDGARADPGC